jgi:hypothetical protein
MWPSSGLKLLAVIYDIYGSIVVCKMLPWWRSRQQLKHVGDEYYVITLLHMCICWSSYVNWNIPWTQGYGTYHVSGTVVLNLNSWVYNSGDTTLFVLRMFLLWGTKEYAMWETARRPLFWVDCEIVLFVGPYNQLPGRCSAGLTLRSNLCAVVFPRTEF